MLVAAAACLVPLWRAPPASTREAERNALKAEFNEAARDHKRGTIGEAEHEQARAEIARRLFRLEDEPDDGVGAGRASRPVLIATALIAPIGAALLYFAVGTPGYADRPVAERQDLPVLVARAQSHLRRNPTDAAGWIAIAPALKRLNRPKEAAEAYGKALEHGNHASPMRSALLTEMAELSMMRSSGRVAPVLANLREAVSLDPTNEKAAYYIALAAEQSGDRQAGADAWSDLLNRFPNATGAWVAVARRKVAELGAPVGPTREAAAAIASLDADGRAQAIEGMVASLAARLDSEPNDPEGWVRLVRSYGVLKRPAEAKAALAKGRSAMASDAATLARLDALEKELGL